MVSFNQISDPNTFPEKAAEDEAQKQIADLDEEKQRCSQSRQ